MGFPYRYVAQITVEAITPLAIGSDLLAYDQDSPVDKDFNSLPYIPGTAIGGYLRKKVNTNLDNLFGDKPEEDKEEHNKQPKGSNLITSDAFLMDKSGNVLQEPTIIIDDFLKKYFNLPIRQHTAINEYGAAKDHNKFDTEIVYKGSRFKFEIELQVSEKKDGDWKQILDTFFRNDFYLGSGEFNNFGELEVVEIEQRYFDLEDKTDRDNYSNHDVDLNTIGQGFNDYKKEITKPYQEKTLKLSGKKSFFHFGAGFGDFEADYINYTEDVVEGWEEDNPDFIKYYVIPGTSIKGTLAHRVAFHYNKENKAFVEDLIPKYETIVENELSKKFDISNFKLANNLTDLEKQKPQLETHLKALEKEALNTAILFEKYLGENNEAVKALFGAAKQSENTEKEKTSNGQSGQIIIKDIYLKEEDYKEHIFTHNKIDRYTGGTIDTALFNEKVLAIDDIKLCYKYKENTDLTNFNKALEDLKKGMLPLGGLVNKGHGIFTELKTNENGN